MSDIKKGTALQNVTSAGAYLLLITKRAFRYSAAASATSTTYAVTAAGAVEAVAAAGTVTT
ncbi:hypothetical protein [Paenibacillus terrigena]|uniref:hypothetical protein n=1 Tax=Paenibacillus terrigena TaxID=369333 RepID=UPI00039DFFD4|nr:hypothetical protein [Paenibacillus terrigena]